MGATTTVGFSPRPYLGGTAIPTQGRAERGLQYLKLSSLLKMADPKLLGLDSLHATIDRCTVCSEFVHPLTKPAPGMDRGNGRDIFIVGIAPGNTEVSSARAFSGASGKRLNQWLIESGRPNDCPRMGVYLTSLIKCADPRRPGAFTKMAARCRHFLEEQLELVRPRLVITLGKESFDYLHIEAENYEKQIGAVQVIAPANLLPPQPFEAIVHWPHPSGLNRWHNRADSEDRMKKSFAEIRGFLEASR